MDDEQTKNEIDKLADETEMTAQEFIDFVGSVIEFENYRAKGDDIPARSLTEWVSRLRRVHYLFVRG